MVASFSNFYGKTSFFYKTVLGIFKIALRLRDWHVFIWQSVKVSNVFNTLTFWKTRTFFKKQENHFLIEATKIENTSFSFKTALSEAIVKTNRVVTTPNVYNCILRKHWSLILGCFFPVSILKCISNQKMKFIIFFIWPWGTLENIFKVKSSTKS